MLSSTCVQGTEGTVKLHESDQLWWVHYSQKVWSQQQQNIIKCRLMELASLEAHLVLLGKNKILRSPLPKNSPIASYELSSVPITFHNVEGNSSQPECVF